MQGTENDRDPFYDSVGGCVFGFFALVAVGVGLVGVFFSYLLIPVIDKRGQLHGRIEIEGLAAQISGAGLLMFTVGLFLITRESLRKNRPFRWILSMLIAVGLAMIAASFLWYDFSMSAE